MDLFNLWIAAITLHKRTPTHLHALMMDTIMSSMIARGRNFLHVPSSISQVPRAPWVPKSRWDSACHDNIPRFLRIFYLPSFARSPICRILLSPFLVIILALYFCKASQKRHLLHMQRRPLKEHPLQPDLAWQRMSISKKVPIHHFVAHWLEIAASVPTDNWHSKELPPNQTHPSKSNAFVLTTKSPCETW